MSIFGETAANATVYVTQVEDDTEDQHVTEVLYYIIIDGFGALVGILMLIYLTQQLRYINLRNKEKQTDRKVVISAKLVLLSYMTLIGFTGTNICATINDFTSASITSENFDSIVAPIVQTIIMLFYATAKTSTWLLLIFRLSQAFSHSSFAVSKCSKLFLSILSTFVGIICYLCWMFYAITDNLAFIQLTFSVLFLYDLMFSVFIQALFFIKYSKMLNLFINSNSMNIFMQQTQTQTTQTKTVSPSAATDTKTVDFNTATEQEPSIVDSSMIAADIDEDINVYDIDVDIHIQDSTYDGMDSGVDSGVDSGADSGPDSFGARGSSVVSIVSLTTSRSNTKNDKNDKNDPNDKTEDKKRKKNKKNKLKQRQDIQFIRIITKFAVLSISIVLTSVLVVVLFMLGVDFNFITLFLAVDSVCACVATVFYYHFANKWFYIACCGCSRAVYHLCRLCIDKKLDQTVTKPSVY